MPPSVISGEQSDDLIVLFVSFEVYPSIPLSDRQAGSIGSLAWLLLSAGTHKSFLLPLSSVQRILAYQLPFFSTTLPFLTPGIFNLPYPPFNPPFGFKSKRRIKAGAHTVEFFRKI
ncbi:MAG TPA: hypothetical protein VD968_02100 [Pyrinomonadaceae bacterium]|nr:hypothetical protein [Pyrinomonadaceae bacterium]